MKPIFSLYIIFSIELQFKQFKLEPEQIITFLYSNLFDMLFIKYTVPQAFAEIIFNFHHNEKNLNICYMYGRTV